MLDTITLMHTSMKRLQGFTLIELLVVIAIIGILATISVLGIGKYQSDTRDARRASSASVIAESLEKFYDQNGEYPSCSPLTTDGTTVTTTTLKGVDPKTLVAPQAESGQTNSIKCTSSGNILTVNGPDFFEYTGDGSLDCAGDGSCLNFTLKYKNEGDNAIKTITSRRTTQLATADPLTLNTNYVGFTTVTLNWSHIGNTAAYTYQRATNADFSAGLVEGSTQDETVDVTGLTKATHYYFRVRATGGNGQYTAWSNVVDINTLDLNSPSITSIVATTTTLKPVWTSVQNASQYRLQYSASNTFPDDTTTTIDNITNTTQLVSGIDQGRLLYFRVYPISGTVTGTASSTSSANTTIATPTKPTMATPTNVDNKTNYVTTWNWSAGSTCPANTTMQYQNQYSYNTSPTYTSAWTTAATTASKAVYTSEGYKYTVNVQARCRSNSTTTIVSAWTATSAASYSQAVTNATGISWTATRVSAKQISMYSHASCRAGASPYGNADPYTRSLLWQQGPNNGKSGWYTTPPAYSFTGLWSPSAGLVNTDAITNGNFFTARATIYCRNSVTNAQSPSAVSTQASGWTWGSNI